MTALAFAAISCSEREAKSTILLIERVVGKIECEAAAGLGAVGAALAVRRPRRGMPRVSRGSGELSRHRIAGYRHRQSRVGDDAGIAATALRLEAVVPITRRRQRDFNVDCRRD